VKARRHRENSVPASPSIQAAIAANRFGLGARPGELRQAAGDPRGFLKAQIRREGADQPPGTYRSSLQMLAAFGDYKDARKQIKKTASVEDLKAQKREAFRLMRTSGEWEELLGRDQLAVATPAGFRERWTRFWANHFTVSGKKPSIAFLSGPFEREAIRPHVFGRFEDMLMASSHHPGMLLYLDQVSSIGPDSPAGGRGLRGLNENLAREMLELHTVGIEAGYTQADVTEFARALTGWTFDQGRDGLPAKAFLFRASWHQPGKRTVMGRKYPDEGEGQARAILRDLAANPKTAEHVSAKIARHFVSEDPPGALVARLAKTWRDTGGSLDRVALALIESPEAWDPAPRKFKTPSDFVISGWRALGYSPGDAQDIIRPLDNLSQRPLIAPSPKGWPEEAATWAAPGELVKRIDTAQEIVAMARVQREPRQVADDALGPMLSPAVADAMAKAESRPQALAILLMSPEFQRR
jgi:uncharacterized protein (DUF1800 family)